MSVFERPIVMLDFETTGLSPAMGDRITEVAALRIVGGSVTERYVSLVNCGVRIPSFITSLTGITQEMVDGAPPAERVVPELLDFIGSDALSSHNASFDEKFLTAEVERLGRSCGHAHLVCLLKLSRRVFPGLASHKLGQLARHLGIGLSSQAHRAEADAEVAAEVLLHICRHIGDSHGLAQVEPSLLATAASMSRVNLSMPDLFRQLKGLEEPGILGPDGRPYNRDLVLPDPIIVCTHLEAKLFEAISRDPELMYKVTPYEFELFVAELLHRQGYDIEVTPPSRDGGVDIYAEKSTEMGNFLFLVECKRYSKENPVPVNVVRALYGIVQAKRATAGIVVTTSTFTRGAKNFQSEMRHQLALQDNVGLRDWISKIRHGLAYRA
jgi:DNA polymerase-3 subunit epsilon